MDSVTLLLYNTSMFGGGGGALFIHIHGRSITNVFRHKGKSRCNLQNSNSHIHKRNGQSSLPVQGVKCLFTALHVALKRLLLSVHSNMDFEAVGGKKGLATALLIADKSVFPTVCLLVSAQVSGGAIGARAALKGALVSLNLRDNRLHA